MATYSTNEFKSGLKIMMDGVRTRNRIIAALIVLLFLVAMYALYLDFHCVQIGFWRG